MHRRDFHKVAGRATLAAVPFGMALPSLAAPSGDARAAYFRGALQAIEKTSGGRLGVAMLDTQSGARLAHRSGERFPLCSTFKLLAAALVLARVDRGEEQLARRIAVLPTDLIPYAPVTQPRVGGEPMTMAELCDAAVTLSDNVAGNLLLQSFGGPAALTAYLRSLGDQRTRLDRIEPELNQALPGDPRDTTTPESMLQTLHRLVLGDALTPGSQAQLTQWLVDNKTGGKKIRAGLPAGWRAGDKTGAGAFGSNNDVAVLWPPGRAPVLVAAYLTGTEADQAGRDEALASVGRLAVALVNGPA